MKTAFLLALLCAAPAAARTREDAMEFGGLKRWWLIHEPAGAAPGPKALVLALHGGGGNPSGAERMTGFDALSDREGFVVVYPAGTGFWKRRLLTWNSGNCCGAAKRDGVDDSGFLAALIGRLVDAGIADPKRVFVTGMSNGGMMSHRLACERADLVAAAAPVAGAIGIPNCAPSRPVSIEMFNGLADQHVPYRGGAGKKSFAPRTDRAVAENDALWAAADKCGPAEVSDGAVKVERRTCAEGTEVVQFTHAGGHVWPGGKAGLRHGNADPPVSDPKASEEIWKFFAAHGR